MIRVDKIIPGGQGLGTSEDGKKIFFWNALPGELVEEYQVTKNKSHYQEAIATKIMHPSPFRVESKDSCYLSTSPWQIIDYTYELQLKQELVVEFFREQHINIDTPQISTDGKDYYYRNKMEYALYWDNKSDQISLAFHQRGSHRKIPIKNSSIERPEIFQRAQQIINELNQNHDEARRYQSLLLRCNQAGKVEGGLYENHQPHPAFPHLTDAILGRTYSYSPNGFFQINLPVYEMALAEIKRHIATNDVLDLYAGVGTIGLSVAPNHHLTLVECDRSAYAELSNNIKLAPKTPRWCSEESVGGYDRDRRSAPPITMGRRDSVSEGRYLGVLARSEEALSYIKPNITVILDPPRSGCDKKLIDKLNEVKPASIIYLSCNPATQARDIKLLLETYQIRIIETFNFFPHTPHIENLVILSRN